MTQMQPLDHEQGALVFAVLLPALLVAHNVADHWVQTHHQAMTKGLPGWTGRWACVAHVATYTAVTTTAVGSMWWLFALPLSAAGVASGQLVSAATHYWADRRTPLEWLARLIGKHEFYALGSPPATGAYALDQAWHWVWLAVAAAITALTTGGLG